MLRRCGLHYARRGPANAPAQAVDGHGDVSTKGQGTGTQVPQRRNAPLQPCSTEAPKALKSGLDQPAFVARLDDVQQQDQHD